MRLAAALTDSLSASASACACACVCCFSVQQEQKAPVPAPAPSAARKKKPAAKNQNKRKKGAGQADKLDDEFLPFLDSDSDDSGEESDDVDFVESSKRARKTKNSSKSTGSEQFVFQSSILDIKTGDPAKAFAWDLLYELSGYELDGKPVLSNKKKCLGVRADGGKVYFHVYPGARKDKDTKIIVTLPANIDYVRAYLHKQRSAMGLPDLVLQPYTEDKQYASFIAAFCDRCQQPKMPRLKYITGCSKECYYYKQYKKYGPGHADEPEDEFEAPEPSESSSSSSSSSSSGASSSSSSSSSSSAAAAL